MSIEMSARDRRSRPIFRSVALAALVSAIAATGFATTPVGRGPAPSSVPVAWELDMSFSAPQRISVKDEQGNEVVYWYLLYEVVNNNDATIDFFPEFDLVTSSLRVIGTDIGISPQVFEAIRKRHELTYAYLVHPTRAIGPLLKGDDNARQSVAIWRASDTDVTNFHVYISGLSGEARVVSNPTFSSARGTSSAAQNPRNFTVRKTLALHYRLPGSDRARTSAAPQLVARKWLMR